MIGATDYSSTRFRALAVLGVIAIIVSLPGALIAFFWSPVILAQGASSVLPAALLILAPIVQIALLARGAVLDRRGENRAAIRLVCVQLIVAAALAAWMILR